MQGTMEIALGYLPVLTDPDDPDSVEVISIDQIYIVKFDLEWLSNFGHFAIAFGGKDSNGKIHPAESACPYPTAHISLADPNFTAAMWDASGNPIGSLTEETANTMFVGSIIPAANSQVWGLTDLAVTVGETLYIIAAPSQIVTPPLASLTSVNFEPTITVT